MAHETADSVSNVEVIEVDPGLLRSGNIPHVLENPPSGRHCPDPHPGQRQPPGLANLRHGGKHHQHHKENIDFADLRQPARRVRRSRQRDQGPDEKQRQRSGDPGPSHRQARKQQRHQRDAHQNL